MELAWEGWLNAIAKGWAQGLPSVRAQAGISVRSLQFRGAQSQVHHTDHQGQLLLAPLLALHTTTPQICPSTCRCPLSGALPDQAWRAARSSTQSQRVTHSNEREIKTVQYTRSEPSIRPRALTCVKQMRQATGLARHQHPLSEERASACAANHQIIRDTPQKDTRARSHSEEEAEKDL